jgi:hypothetical protein
VFCVMLVVGVDDGGRSLEFQTSVVHMQTVDSTLSIESQSQSTDFKASYRDRSRIE